jgi:hypothetical protein
MKEREEGRKERREGGRKRGREGRKEENQSWNSPPGLYGNATERLRRRTRTQEKIKLKRKETGRICQSLDSALGFHKLLHQP